MAPGNTPGIGTLARVAHPDLPAALQTVVGDVIGSSAAFGETITIRRSSSTLSAQNVRLVYRPSSTEQQSGQAEQKEARVFVVGTTSLDIQEADRFNDSNGTLFEVEFVRPNRQVMTVAEAVAIQ